MASVEKQVEGGASLQQEVLIRSELQQCANAVLRFYYKQQGLFSSGDNRIVAHRLSLYLCAEGERVVQLIGPGSRPGPQARKDETSFQLLPNLPSAAPLQADCGLARWCKRTLRLQLLCCPGRTTCHTCTMCCPVEIVPSANSMVYNELPSSGACSSAAGCASTFRNH